MSTLQVAGGVRETADSRMCVVSKTLILKDYFIGSTDATSVVQSRIGECDWNCQFAFRAVNHRFDD